MKLKQDDRVKLKREEGDLDPRENSDWCVLATEKTFTRHTRFFMIRKENIVPA